MQHEHPRPEPGADDDSREGPVTDGDVAGRQPPASTPRPQPVTPAERIDAVDVLRGFALLGILTMNILAMAWPFAGYENPRLSGGDDWLNVAALYFNSLVFSGKMMSLFSMLFGAGLVLMSERAAARGSSILGSYYRRMFWLLAIGMVHAYLIWAGDILVHYAMCGLLLYLFRRRSPRTLIILGVILLAMGSAAATGFTLYAGFAANIAQQVHANQAAGKKSEPWQMALHDAWHSQFRSMFESDEKEIERYRRGYLDIARHRAGELPMFQIFGFLFFMMWGAGGRMLLGMALMKLRVFSAERSWRFYRLMALFGYGFGLTLTIVGLVLLATNNYEALRSPWGGLVYGLGMVPTALGHVAVIMMICKSGAAQWLTVRFAAVGRMALTNYLAHSVIGTTLFYGYGFNLFGRVDRIGLWGIVLAIWAVQLIVSPLWLRYFRYGPVEWLWRSLTYWRWQPMRNPATEQ